MKAPNFYVILLNILITFTLVFFTGIYFKDKMPLTTRQKSKERFELFLEYLPQIQGHSEQATLFIGTSIFEYFLDPRYFDEQMRHLGVKSESYNVAFEGNLGLGMLALVSRLNDEFKVSNKKVKNIVFELSPVSLNQKFYNRHNLMMDIGNPDVFMNISTWQNMFIKKPAATSYLYINSLLPPFNWLYLPVFTNFLSNKSQFKKSVRFAGIANVWSNPSFYERPQWNISTRGLVNWNLPHSKKEFDHLYEQLHQEDHWQEMIGQYRRGNGLFKRFSYEENLISLYIDSVNIAKNYAENIYIVNLPYAPTFQKYVDMYVDQAYLIKRIKSETGISVLDLQKSLELENKDFMDAMHLTTNTLNQFLDILVKKISNNSTN